VRIIRFFPPGGFCDQYNLLIEKYQLRQIRVEARHLKAFIEVKQRKICYDWEIEVLF
jgi:hypothetical protein